MVTNKFTMCIIGYKRNGKDEAAEFLRDNFGMGFQSSSQAAADIFIYEELKDKYGYSTSEECFEDRVNHREEWFDMIREYNKNDETRLARDIVDLHGTYVGMRSHIELDACKSADLFDLVIWIDAEKRVGKEDESSCTVRKDQADIIIDNNGTLEQFHEKLHRLGLIIFGR